eukprot:CAMPEP_0119135058 /NCGR_PEP_ID=MMETSP1310-20130426/18553_1 /TAXON_ID=464262 /ORGANISM="Genus nov. species nov., Strain RCC2339" /LENGTH=105 /DNA_ID=CAMNT_0007125911 /DNA_START=88 /DNA_END=401 /DNA_ORIENTATION=-
MRASWSMWGKVMQRRKMFMPNYDMVVTNPNVRSGNPEVRKFEVRVPMKMGKIDIRNYLENVYDIRVKKVNTSITQGKFKRTTTGYVKRKDYKKAIVTVRNEGGGG